MMDHCRDVVSIEMNVQIDSIQMSSVSVPEGIQNKKFQEDMMGFSNRASP